MAFRVERRTSTVREHCRRNLESESNGVRSMKNGKLLLAVFIRVSPYAAIGCLKLVLIT